MLLLLLDTPTLLACFLTPRRVSRPRCVALCREEDEQVATVVVVVAAAVVLAVVAVVELAHHRASSVTRRRFRCSRQQWRVPVLQRDGLLKRVTQLGGRRCTRPVGVVTHAALRFSLKQRCAGVKVALVVVVAEVETITLSLRG